MIYVGIDVAKDKYDCYFDDSENELSSFNLRIENNYLGFKSLSENILRVSNCNLNNVMVGLDSTGHYSSNLIAFLKHLNLSITGLNPLIVNRFRKARTLRSTKTDKSDAKLIAEYIKCSDFNSHQDIFYHTSTLKSLSRARMRLIKLIQQLKNNYRRCLQLVFPEFEKHFNVYLNSYLLLLEKYPGPKAILNAK